MTTLGGSCTSRGGSFGFDATYISDYTFSGSGTVTSVCVYAGVFSGTGSITAMFFRPNGGNWDYIGESSTQTMTNTTKESFTLSCNVSVQSGDIIGWYTDSNGEIAHDLSGSHTYYRESGKQTGTNINFSTSFTSHGDTSILATISITDVYVDINKSDDSGDGFSWANAKKTMAAGYALLDTNTTMHVATGDYSAQTTITYNKNWSLSPEDPNAVGNKTVSIPKST